MLRSIPSDFNLTHYIMREHRIDAGQVSKLKLRMPRVMYRYSRASGVVTGRLVGTYPHENLVVVELDNGCTITRHFKSFDLIDSKGKMADYILEYYK